MVARYKKNNKIKLDAFLSMNFASHHIYSSECKLLALPSLRLPAKTETKRL